MRGSIPFFALLLAVGCTPLTVEVSHVPPPSAELLAVQSRVLSLPPAAVFPRILDVLMNEGFLIVSANRDLGLVTIHRQWDEQQGNVHPLLSLDATLVFSAEGTDRTRVRAQIYGGIHAAAGSGKTYSTYDGAPGDLKAGDYENLLDRVEKGLLGSTKG
jgi:hypothetical protein